MSSHCLLATHSECVFQMGNCASFTNNCTNSIALQTGSGGVGVTMLPSPADWPIIRARPGSLRHVPQPIMSMIYFTVVPCRVGAGEVP